MGDTERPIPERLGDQDEQAQHLTRTGNGPTVENEEQLLAEVHGPADMAGFYSRPEPVDQDDAEPADDVEGEAADQDDAAPAADTTKGGDSA
ncbi:hypothetical protein [Streptomyces swartbergensis]|uniref:Uncharacterized protein n=1 Tax=Streptomyces swartbergensis TaxID=487165 RepID=A0A243S4X4_9ACTN|nr:hypothetical protein [Streptomyces swartbergensis]OUD02579.1 hypothetical protein CA983_14230 [Streptomyces swartbergensis]